MVFLWLIIILSFVIAIYFYPQMPDEMASHWNAEGEVDGYMSKFWGLFLMPLVSVILLVLFLFIPKIDPLKDNYAKFRKYYDGFIVIMILFFFYIYLLTISWNFNFKFNMTVMILPAIAALFFYLGVLMQNSKRNWFVGIRTPWTLSSDVVWNKTHRLGGLLFKVLAVVFIGSLFFQKYAVFIIIAAVIPIVVFLFAYSYYEYRKLK